MFKHYVKMAFRSVMRDKSFALLNLCGLGLALAVFLLTVMFLRDEMRYDRHSAAERQYRIAADVKIGERELGAPMTPGPLAALLKEDFTSVEATCRVHKTERTVEREPSLFRETDFLLVDADCLDFFGLELVQGEPARALTEPRSVVLSQETARRYFGDSDAVGQALVVEGEEYTVSGVVRETGRRSHLRFAMLAPLAHAPAGPWVDSWLANNFYTYVQLREGSAADLEASFAGLIEKHVGPSFGQAMGTTFDRFLESGGRLRYYLQPVRDIHLRSNLEHELGPNGSLTLLYILGVLALLVLVVASINYVNFTTARATRRALEVGLRKTLGATPGQLRVQFLLEALLVSLVAAVIGLLLATLFLPSFNRMVAGTYTLVDLYAGSLLTVLLLATLAVAFLSGAYPTMLLANFPPISMVNRRLHRGAGARRFREALVAFQFVVAMVLIVSAFVVHRQLRFLVEQDLGFDPRGVLIIDRARALGEDWAAFRAELRGVPGVTGVAGATSAPGRLVREVFFGVAGGAGDEMETAWLLDAEPTIFQVLAIPVLEGVAFTEADVDRAVVVVSPTAARRLNFLEPLGESVEISARPTNPAIIGVIPDLHVQSLHQPVRPAVLRPLTSTPGIITVGVAPGERSAVEAKVAALWRRFVPHQPLEISALQEEIALLYGAESRMLDVSRALTLVALLIACLGILGLAALSCQQRTKEIGIRKVLGATGSDIVVLLTGDLVRLVAVAVIVASPLAAYMMQRWLESFAYRLPLPWWVFPLAAGVVTAAALLSAGYQALGAARARAITSLRYE
jgi:putative ABC transport system permease protein